MSEEQAQETQEEDKGLVVDNEGNEVDIEKAVENDGKKPEDEPEIEYPEWLPEKFRSGEDWQEKLGQSYTELEKTLREKGKVAPDEYETPEDYKDYTDLEAVQNFGDFAKEMNLNQAQYEGMLKFAEDNGLFEVPDYEAEMAKLGDEKDTILKSIDGYMSQRLTPKEQEVMESMAYTSEQAKLIYKMIRANNNVPAKPGEAVNQQDNKTEMQKKLSMMLSDPEIRSNHDKKREAEELARRIAAM